MPRRDIEIILRGQDSENEEELYEGLGKTIMNKWSDSGFSTKSGKRDIVFRSLTSRQIAKVKKWVFKLFTKPQFIISRR